MAAKIRQMVLDGASHAAIAAAVSTKQDSVSRRAVGLFIARHGLEIAETKQRAARQVESRVHAVHIANKAYRLAVMQEALDELLQEARTRGYVYVQERTSPDGEVTTRTNRINEPLIRSLDRLMRHAAEEMGEIPRWQAPSEGKGYGAPGDAAAAAVEVDGAMRQVSIYRNVPERLGVGPGMDYAGS